MKAVKEETLLKFVGLNPPAIAIMRIRVTEEEFEDLIGPLDYIRSSILDGDVINSKIGLLWSIRIKKVERGWVPISHSFSEKSSISLDSLAIKKDEGERTQISSLGIEIQFSKLRDDQLFCQRIHDEYIHHAKIPE